MITIDRDSGTPISEQLVRQLRFQIASGRYQVGDILPSTRTLATQLGVSFHTVRKSYTRLAEIGLVEAKGGHGFAVVATKAGRTSDQLEDGAVIAAEAVKRLLGLGLAEGEVEALLIEQLDHLQEASSIPEALFAAPYLELAQRCSELIESVVSIPIKPIALTDIASHPDAEYVIAPFPSLQRVLRSAPEMEVIGVTVFYSHDLQEALAHLTPLDTVAIAVMDPTSVEPIMIDIRQQTGFSGQVFGISAYADRNEFESILDQVELLLYTHQSRRRVQSRLGGRPSVELDPRIAPESLDVVKRTLALRA